MSRRLKRRIARRAMRRREVQRVIALYNGIIKRVMREHAIPLRYLYDPTAR